MTPSLLTPKNVIVQGITGTQGAFHTEAMIQAGTPIVAGTSPNKNIQTVHGLPVYPTIAAIMADYAVDCSVIFVPAPYAKVALIEAIDAKVPLIICITEGIPIHDMLYIKQYMVGKSSQLIGPNSPGILVPSVCRLGIIPDQMGLPGAIGIVSRSGTLTYETMAGLSEKGIGQKYVIGIGGDPIKGTGFIDCLRLFESDPAVSHIVMIGEIGGTEELMAADYIQSSVTKPVFSYITGHHAPAHVQLGHAGAILGSDAESAAAKTAALRAAGSITATSIVELVHHVNDTIR